ncbi:GroES-like protein [Xylariaceae sp. FL0255]|nr:GroES-like protein [Xylariaceae sp. FL0255]
MANEARTNHALVLTTLNSPFEKKVLPVTPPGPNEVTIQNYAVGINSVDAAIPLLGTSLLPYLQLPCVVGCDVAGVVVDVGHEMERFKPGDRVVGYAAGTLPIGNRPSEGGFQNFTVLRDHLTAVIPSSLPYADAVALSPLCFSTAAYGLFHHSFLGLSLPGGNAAAPKNGKAIVITSGASSVGANAIQLAVAAGYEVYSTASPSNFDLVRSLGATAVFDYHQSNSAAEIVAALKGKEVVGGFSINSGGVAICAEVINNSNSRKFIADAGPPPSTGYPEGITSKFIDLLDVGNPDDVVGKVYRDFLPQALSTGLFRPAPNPEVVGRSLEDIQEAVNNRLKGVSAVKPVVIVKED